MRLTVRWKLALLTALTLAAFSAVWISVTFLQQRRAAVADAQTRLLREVQLHTARFDTMFRSVEQIVRGLAGSIAIHPDLSDEQIAEHLEQGLLANPLVFGSAAAFEPGALPDRPGLFSPYLFRSAQTDRPRAPGAILEKDLAFSYDYTRPGFEWYTVPRDTRRVHWTEPYLDTGGGEIAMCTYSVPILREGRFMGVATADVDLADLRRVAGDLGVRDRFVAMFSRRGTVVSYPDPAAILHGTIEAEAERTGREDLRRLAASVAAGRPGAGEMMGIDDATLYLIAHAPIPSTGWTLLIGTPKAEALAPAFVHLWTRVIESVLMVALAAGLLMLAGLWVTRPLHRLSDAVSRLGGGDLREMEQDVRRNDEIGDLARAYNTMVGQLSRYVEALTKQTRAREAADSELRVAREIQQALLPPPSPGFSGSVAFDLRGTNIPAEQVGGDFFDYFMLPDGSLVLLIADVSGKGVPAAIFMAVSRTVIKNLAMEGLPPAEVLRRANTALLADNARGLFVTVFLARYSPASGELTHASAGHLPPMVIGIDRSVRTLSASQGTVLGCLEDQVFSQSSDRLEPGERLVLYTDGLTEARSPSGQLFGEARLRQLLAETPAGDSRETLDALIGAASEFQADRRADDLTAVVLRRTA
ncbi:MAG: SpoIIE family protein phosphatase [Phycisphaerales bacterium]|nr:SpoIIE family protein phosphatase [Phycisphaerales bacterium]